MSIIPANIDYVKMSQILMFAQFSLKKYEETNDKKYLDNIHKSFTKIAKVLDDGVDYDLLKQMGVYR